MGIKYKITEIAKKTLENFDWLKLNYTLGELGSDDEREITRLLKNSNKSNLKKILELIDTYGNISQEIVETILECNDKMSFERYLAELFLFNYLYEKLESKVNPIRRINKQKTPDLSIKINNLEVLIEIYSPIDYYGYQTFNNLLDSCIMNLPISLGFNIFIDSESEDLFYTLDFPEFRDVYKWLDRFTEKISDWLIKAKVGDIITIDSPSELVKLKIHLKALENDPDNRSVSRMLATRSTDTIQYFRIENPAKFAVTDLGIKIKDKLTQQQAGNPRDNVVRILAINFALMDTTDFSFLNESYYHNIFDSDIRYLSSNIEPYPPYDIIIPSDLRFDCNFAKPIILFNKSESIVYELLSTIGLN